HSGFCTRNHGYLNNYKVSPAAVIRKPEKATKKGSLAVLKGPIAPEGAVINYAAGAPDMDPPAGAARVCNSGDDAQQA
ncbi:dihydroxy-acid dehydratase, partial [Salmonella enterica subsp. enterica serovar Infantis]